jgi:hypothetical protein
MGKIKLQIGKGISKSWISNFLSNVLGVIVGIALTFGTSYLIQRHNEKEDAKEMMTLIKKELDTNKLWLKKRRQNYVDDFKSYQKILIAKESGNLRNIPADSLVNWIATTRNTPASFISTNAWDIFKNTETLAKFHNKALIIDLAECYFWIDNARETMDMFFKGRDVLPEYFNYETYPYDYIDTLFANEETKTFLTNRVMFKALEVEGNFTIFEILIDYVLYLIEKDENADKDILDFDSFREQKDNEAVKLQK